MNPFLDKIWDYAVHDQTLSMQRRFYRLTTLVAAILCLGVIVPVNMLQNLPLMVDVVVGAFGLFSLLLYREARAGHDHINLFFFSLMLMLDVTWFPNAGSAGSTIFYFFPAIIYPMVLYRGNRRWVMIALLVADLCMLLLLEHYFPSVVTPFNSQVDRLMDLLTGAVFSMLAWAVILWVVVANYDSEQNRIAKYSKQLAESEKKYRELVEAANSVILTWDITGRITFMNNFGNQFFGFFGEELLGKNVVGTIVPQTESSGRDLARLMEVIQHDPDSFKDNENENITKNGSRVWIRWANKAIRDDQGKLIGILSIGNDITARKIAESRLSDSERFIRNILDTVDEGFIVVDRDYRIQTANRAYCDRLPVPCSEIIGKHCYEVSYGKSRPCFEEGEKCAVHQAFADGNPHSTLHKHAGPDNSVLFVETKAYPLKDISGKVTSIIEVSTNVTEKRLLEEERLKTQKLEAVGTLAGGIAHDFNNLLQGVFGYISLAKLKKDDREKSMAALEEAEKALHMTVKLTNQLLTFSKGGKPVKKVMAPLPLIESAAKFALSGSRTNAHISADNGLWKIDADEGQISQVIQNIVLNADQAMPDAGQIEITAKNVQVPGPDLPQELTHGRYVEITISDNGIGIPEKYLRRIFDPYFTTKEKGSGLGLATSYSIIKNHNGVIDVASELGKGTSFRIYIPATTDMAPDKQPAPVMATSGKKGRILVMDDDEIILNIAGELINALGHDVEFAKNGTEALKKYVEAQRSAKPFDIAILDLTIRGGMGGAETVKKLLEVDPNVKAVVSSGYADDSAIASYENQRFKAVLKKPYNVDELREVLNRLLNN